MLGASSTAWLALVGVALHLGAFAHLDTVADNLVWRPFGPLRDLAQLLADLGNPFVFIVLLALLAGIGVVYLRLRLVGLAIIGILVSTLVTEEIAKPLFDIHEFGTRTLTYPSGHTVGSFSIAGAICLLFASGSSSRRPLAKRVRTRVGLASLASAFACSIAMVVVRGHTFGDLVGSAPFAFFFTIAIVASFGQLLAPASPPSADGAMAPPMTSEPS